MRGGQSLSRTSRNTATRWSQESQASSKWCGPLLVGLARQRRNTQAAVEDKVPVAEVTEQNPFAGNDDREQHLTARVAGGGTRA